MTAEPVDLLPLPGPVDDGGPVVLVVDVLGEPVPQGSMIPITRKGKTILIPDNSAGLKRWRGAVVAAARARVALAGWLVLDGPVALSVTFWLTRPAAAKGRARPHVRPDLDKLVRAVMDALTEAGVWSDDSRVVRLSAAKHYAVATPGARIVIGPLR